MINCSPTENGGFIVSADTQAAKFKIERLPTGELLEHEMVLKDISNRLRVKKPCSKFNHRKRRGVGDLVRGASGIIKAELGLGAADTQKIDRRKKLCLDCEHYDFGECNACGCMLPVKVKLNNESCPEGKW